MAHARFGMRKFLSTPSARRATRAGKGHRDCPAISIHALREEGDAQTANSLSSTRKFLSTPSARRATCCQRFVQDHCGYFYPRPPRGGRRCSQVRPPKLLDISIHALREEGDDCFCLYYSKFSDFYPRPPRGGRLNFQTDYDKRVEFLSTPSARRATTTHNKSRCRTRFLSTPSARRATRRRHRRARSLHEDFYPRPPRGGRLELPAALPVGVVISIHALREEGDSKNRDKISIFL